MLATILSDTALLVAALTPLVLAAAIFVLVWRKGFKRVDARLSGMEVTLEGIDKAVNSVPAGTAPLKDKVAVIEDKVAGIEGTQVEHSGQIAAVRAELDAGFAAVHERLDQMAAEAARHHPEDGEAR